jgi:predicted amidohydrolase
MTRTVNIALVQFTPRKGEYQHNLARLREVFETIATLTPHPDVITFPESAFTGYFLEGGVRDLACSADAFVGALHAAYRESRPIGDRPIDVVAGFYEVHDNTYFNSAVYATLAPDAPHIVHIHRKVFLPTYGLFDEERFVERGLDVRAFDTPWGRAAILVCEDAWHSLTATIAALDGAQILFIPSASPARGAWVQPDEVEETADAGNVQTDAHTSARTNAQTGTPANTPGPISAPASLHRWERLARDRAEEHGVFVAVTQLVGNEGGKAFAGGSVVVGPHGDVRARGPLWEEAVLAVSVDLEDMTRARADSPLLADLRILLPHLGRALRRTISDEHEPS